MTLVGALEIDLGRRGNHLMSSFITFDEGEGWVGGGGCDAKANGVTK